MAGTTRHTSGHGSPERGRESGDREGLLHTLGRGHHQTGTNNFDLTTGAQTLAVAVVIPHSGPPTNAFSSTLRFRIDMKELGVDLGGFEWNFYTATGSSLT